MAQASNQIRSSKSKYTWSVIIFIVILFILSPFSPPKVAMASKPTNTVPIETIAVEHKQTRTMPSLDTVNELLRTHPHPNVRGEFYEMIRDGKIKIVVSKGSGYGAAFMLVPATLMQATGLTPLAELSPTLIIDQTAFTSGDLLYMQLALYHEFVHYDQWQDARIPEDAFVMEPLALKLSIKEACMKKWYAELEAHHMTCEFARTKGLLDRMDNRMAAVQICRAKKETFHDTLREMLTLGDPGARVCSTTWASL